MKNVKHVKRIIQKKHYVPVPARHSFRATAGCLCLPAIASKRRPGAFVPSFTLVELMVVLAVIALLIMLIIPNMRNAFRRAESTACKNNLHQFNVAMGRYMSDWKGYFIWPGQGGEGALQTSIEGAYDKTAIPGGVHRHGGVSSSRAHDWGDFIAGYIPDQITLQSLNSGKQSVRVCPSVLREIRAQGNYFDPRSANFKGIRTEYSEIYGVDIDYADWEEMGGSGYGAEGNLILENYFTIYGINPKVVGKDRKLISDKTIAFIDWNAKDGWRGEITHTNWMFTSQNRNPNVTQGTLKGTNWWVNEVGFHHIDGTNAFANYVAMDGSVGSITSNEITLKHFQASGP